MAGDMRHFWLGVLLALPVAAMAEPLADPTQPPAGIMGPDGTTIADPGSAGLTSVLLPRKGKPSAIIDGKVVTLGEAVGEARLVRVSETGVVLEGPAGVERMYLSPDVEKKMNMNKNASRRKKE